MTVVQHAPSDSEDKTRVQPSDSFISTLRTDHPSHIDNSPNQFEKRDDPIRDGRLDSMSTLPIDSTMDFPDWFSGFNDVSSSWMPIDDNDYDTGVRAVIDPGTVESLFRSSFNTWSVMGDSVQISDFNADAEGFTM